MAPAADPSSGNGPSTGTRHELEVIGRTGIDGKVPPT